MCLGGLTGYSIQDEASDVQITDPVSELHRKNETFPRISHLEQFTPRILLIQFSQLPGLPMRGDQDALVQGPCLGDLGMPWRTAIRADVFQSASPPVRFCKTTRAA